MLTASVLSFPVRPAHPPAPTVTPAVLRRRESEVDVPELQARLGWQAASRRTVIEHLRILFRKAGLPAPKNPRIVKGELLAGDRAIHAGSVWHRVVIDDWFDDRTPPASRAALAQATRNRVRADLADRARRIAG